MADSGHGRSYGRPAHRAGRLALRALGVILAIPCWLFWLLAILLLPIGKPFVQLPLGLCAVGGLFAGVLFALGKARGDAAIAVLLGLGAAVLLAVYTSIAEKIDPEFGRPTPWPPWWWYF
ncbi:hypothetical protein [Sphingobium indicum]